MFHEYDLEEIHRDVENSLPRIPNGFSSTTNLTKMNVIVPIIPEPTREIMDFTLLVAGVSLNTLLGLVIVFNSATRTSLNCYIMSLVCSNVAILLEPLQQVLRWTFRTGLSMNLDYIFLVTFDVSALTIILLNIETYVVVCQKNSPLRAPLLKVSTAVKAVSCVWTMCITLTAMELHMYDHFEEEVMYDICMSSTVMFLIAPCFIFIMLDCFILYELILSKSTDGEWPGEDTERFVLLAGVTLGFLLNMTPYRVMRATTLVISFYCSDTTVEIVYTMVKLYPTILPVTCFALSKELRRAAPETLRCCCRKRRKNSTVIELA